VRTITVVTVARSDYGIALPIMRGICAARDLRLQLLVAGAHLAPELGLTVTAIEADGFPIAGRIETFDGTDSAEATAAAIARGISGFARSYRDAPPDIVLVIGDRFEMYAAAVAAVPFNLPIAHVHGGELTLGAIDDALRHSITKLSHLHFVAADEYARRVVQMGEEPWRVVVSGAPALDRVAAFRARPAGDVERALNLRLTPAPLLVTLHPATLEPDATVPMCRELLAAIDAAGVPAVFTSPGADSGGRTIVAMLTEYVASRSTAWFVPDAGADGYFDLMAHATAMVGNSSSGIVEAPSFELPVVNIGSRQEGRMRARNVIDVDADRAMIRSAIARATSPTFRASLVGLRNPYGDGGAAAAIVERLRAVPLDGRLLKKRFHDLPAAQIVGWS
jgi:UDP-hydrolysing UDP-N-acetyl-D-glucosamine 2-epimerase